MKYYTKQWLEDLKNADLILNFEMIKDDEYTKDKIKALYDQKLYQTINETKEDYNAVIEKPTLLDEDFSLEDFVIIDEQTNALKHPTNLKEVEDFIEKEYEEALEHYHNRAPFNPTDVIEIFEEDYQSALKYIKEECPSWLLEEVDVELLALGYLPKTQYQRLKKETKALEKNIEKLENAAAKEMVQQDIPDEIYDALALHDDSLLSLKKVGKNLVMITSDESYPNDINSPYHQIIFKNVEVLENENIRPRKLFNGFVYYSHTNFLYHEIYNHEDQYEVHMMIYTTHGPAYLTVLCDDIESVETQI